MPYLMLWRMQIAAHLLADSSMKVATVGSEIGYDSEVAFSWAFRKTAGASPAACRGAAAATHAAADQTFCATQVPEQS